MHRKTPTAPVFDCDQVEDAEAAWRTERFLELGCTLAESVALAESAADWHEAAALVAAGCAPTVAARILAPLP